MHFDHLEHGRSLEHDRVAETSTVPQALAIERAVQAFAMHEAARERHVAVIARARETMEDTCELRVSRQRLREHTDAALVEMQRLRGAVRSYAHALRQSHVSPQRALAVMKSDIHDFLGAIPSVDRIADAAGLATQMVQWMTDAYYDAA